MALLLREYVERALYERAGYFSKQVIGGLRSPLPFTKLRNEAAYREALSMTWHSGEEGSGWLTPSETFTPFYGEAVARSIVARHRHNYPGEPLQMMEIGAGNGTFARDVLQYLKREEPQLYAGCKYLILEISPQYAALQQENLISAAGLGGDDPKWEVVNQCATAWAAERSSGGGGDGSDGSSRSALKGPWWITMLEVLDNLGHDRLRVSSDGSCEEAVVKPRQGMNKQQYWRAPAPQQPERPTHETERLEYWDGLPVQPHWKVESLQSPGRGEDTGVRQQWEQSWRPLSDPELIRAASLLNLNSYESLQSLRDAVAHPEDAATGAKLASGLSSFLDDLMGGDLLNSPDYEVLVPTGCWRMLKGLCAAVPEAHFTIADFSWLPRQADGAINAPVVQMQRGGMTVDLKGDYLRAYGAADILFPTNFNDLGLMIEAAIRESRKSGDGNDGLGAREPVRNVRTADFMRRWHPVESTATESGFNPLLDEFSNTRFLITGDCPEVGEEAGAAAAHTLLDNKE